LYDDWKSKLRANLGASSGNGYLRENKKMEIKSHAPATQENEWDWLSSRGCDRTERGGVS